MCLRLPRFYFSSACCDLFCWSRTATKGWIKFKLSWHVKRRHKRKRNFLLCFEGALKEEFVIANENSFRSRGKRQNLLRFPSSGFCLRRLLNTQRKGNNPKTDWKFSAVLVLFFFSLIIFAYARVLSHFFYDKKKWAAGRETKQLTLKWEGE